MRAARWTLGLVAALAAQVARAQVDGGVPDDSLAPLIEEGGPGQPTRPAGPPADPGGGPRAPPATGAPERDDVVRVQLPTRTPEALEWAPSVVTVLTREELL